MARGHVRTAPYRDSSPRTASGRMAVAAESLGINSQRATTIRLQLEHLLRGGMPLAVHVTGISSLFVRVRSWAELGVDESDVRAEQYTRGTRALFPVHFIKPLRSLEGAVRRNLVQHSYNVSWFSPYRIVMNDALPSWSAKHRELIARADRAKGSLRANWDVLYDIALEQAEEAAIEAWDALEGRGKANGDRTQFIHGLIEDTRKQLSDRDAFLRNISFTVSEGLLLDPASIERNLIEADELRRDRERRSRLADHESTQERIRREVQLDTLRQQLNSMASPFQEAIDQLSERVMADVQALSASLQNGYLPGPSVRRGRELVRFWQLMGFVQNDNLDRAMNLLNTMLRDQSHLDRDQRVVYTPSQIKGALHSISDAMHHLVEETQQQGATWFAGLDLPAPVQKQPEPLEAIDAGWFSGLGTEIVNE